jgi:solute:Na+ symporter, SSS family
VVIYTMIGGLWAVLMTDVLQFIVLTLAVLFVVPLVLAKAGGLGAVIESVPPEFFRLVSADYTWFFIAGWCAIHFFMIGAEWAFVQRFICVPSARDAQKGAYLFGALYLASPFLWLLPPMIYRTIDPAANPEEAYILACKSVLPAGMIGLMLAAMFSATASMVSSQLNVFAGVLTNDIYRPLRSRQLSERECVWTGRGFTVLLGGILLSLALAIPKLGGAEKVIISITSLLVGPLLAPTLWGLLSRRIRSAAVWVPASVCFAAGLLIEFGLRPGGFFVEAGLFSGLAEWVQENRRTKDILLGVVLPVALIALVQALSKGTSEGWRKVAALAGPAEDQVAPVAANRKAGMVVGWSLAICALLMGSLLLFDPDEKAVLIGFTLSLAALAALVLRLSWRAERPDFHDGRRADANAAKTQNSDA